MTDPKMRIAEVVLPPENGSDHRLARSQLRQRRTAVLFHFVRRLIEITSRRQQTQRTLLDWLRVECRGKE